MCHDEDIICVSVVLWSCGLFFLVLVVGLSPICMCMLYMCHVEVKNVENQNERKMIFKNSMILKYVYVARLFYFKVIPHRIL